MTLRPSRRDFLGASGSLLGATWLVGLEPALEAAGRYARGALREDRPFAVFTGREAADFEALSAVIIPSGETPGAREAGVVHFADRALGTFFSPLVSPVRQGLADLRDRVRSSHDGVDGYADLSEATQVEILREVEVEDPDFFQLTRTLVVLGMFSHPDHGGNRDEVGWRLIGLERDPSFQPPFGAYDTVAEEG